MLDRLQPVWRVVDQRGPGVLAQKDRPVGQPLQRFQPGSKRVVAVLQGIARIGRKRAGVEPP